MRTLSVPLNHDLVPSLQFVEVATFFQIPAFHIVGLPAREVEEARERIRAAIESSELEFPRRRIILNLSPANIRKRGTGLDLPMALAVLVSGLQGPLEVPPKAFAAWGELGLDGSVKSVGQITRAVHAAASGHISYLILPRQDLPAARDASRLILDARISGVCVPKLIGVGNLCEAWEAFRDPESAIDPSGAVRSRISIPPSSGSESSLSVSPWLGRLLGAAAAGRHHLLLLGPRGAGKSVALETLATAQPKITAFVRLRQVLAQELASPDAPPPSDPGSGLVRRVGTSASLASLVGGFRSESLIPGEYTLADGGLLLADEFPEWNRQARESLREPLQSGVVTLTRRGCSLRLPAHFRLGANGNLCPCGAWPQSASKRDARAKGSFSLELEASACRCSDQDRKKYLARLSGPVLDRIDMVSLISGNQAAPEDEAVLPRELNRRVSEVHSRLTDRWGKPPGELSASEINHLLSSHSAWRETLSARGLTSLRSVHQTLRVAITLSGWDGEDGPLERHLIEASFLRPEKTGIWES